MEFFHNTLLRFLPKDLSYMVIDYVFPPIYEIKEIERIKHIINFTRHSFAIAHNNLLYSYNTKNGKLTSNHIIKCKKI